jgi:nuclear pore complex protein Nup107
LIFEFTLVSQKALPENERVLYAALAPSLETAPVLKEACRTWEDHLWVETSIMCEEKLRLEMIALCGGFWEGGLPAIEKAQDTLREAIETEDDAWESEADAALDKLKSVQVREGYGCSLLVKVREHST